LSVFNVLEEGFYRKLLVLRNLEAKFLKKNNLCGLIREMEPGATPRVYAESKTLKDQVSLLRGITGKWGDGGRH
jgi:hypothetical protein